MVKATEKSERSLELYRVTLLAEDIRAQGLLGEKKNEGFFGYLYNHNVCDIVRRRLCFQDC